MIVTTQIAQLDAKVSESVQLIKTNQSKALSAALSIEWETTGVPDVDELMSSHYSSVRGTLLAKLQGLSPDESDEAVAPMRSSGHGASYDL